MFQGKPKANSLPDSYILFSSNENLCKQLSLVFKNKVAFFDLKKEKMVNSCLVSKGKRVEIILDNQYVSFKKCIEMLETLKHKRITFKILPKNTNFVIGSDSKNERGKMVKIQ